MARDFYIAPAGSGTSGTGTSRANPIVGLGSVNSNAIGASVGDRLIFLPGTYYEQFTIPTSGLTLISDNDGALWDGTTSLNGDATVASTHVPTTTGNPWTQYSVGLNIWKKGCISAPYLFLDSTLIYPMDSSILTQSLANVDNLTDLQYTLRTETTGSSTVTLYLKLPIGKTPANYDIRTTYRLNPTSGTVTSLIYVGQKSDISFEGKWSARGCNHSNGLSLPIWIDRCTNVTNKNGLLYAEYMRKGGITISGGSDIRLQTDTRYSSGAGVCIGVPTGITGNSSYDGGEIEIYNWNADYCGSIPEFITGQRSFNDDFDGGVGIGYKYVKQTSIIVRNGTASNYGPQYEEQPAGWATVASTRGSAVFAGTIDPMVIGKLSIIGNSSVSGRRIAYQVDTGTTTGNRVTTINIIGNSVDNLLQQTYGTFNGATQTSESGITTVKLGASDQPAANITIANNTISNSKYTRSLYEIYLQGSAPSSTINFFNNEAYGNTIKASFPNEYGLVNIRATITGGFNKGGNIYDKPGIYARNVSTNLTDLTAWNAHGNLVATEQQGTVSLSTATRIGVGYKYWTGARPSDVNGEPLPDTAIDIGAIQSTINANHPKNLINSSNPSATAMDLITYSPTELQVQLDKVTELDGRVDGLEAVAPTITFKTPQEYGAIGNGTVDDTVALQAAIDASSNAFPLYLPAGKTYKITSTIVLPSNVTIIGAGRNFNSVILPVGCVPFKVDGSLYGGGWAFRILLRDFLINMTNASGTSGIDLRACYNVDVKNVFQYNQPVGVTNAVYISKANDIIFEDFIAYGASSSVTRGFDIDGVTIGECRSIKLIKPDIEVFNRGIRTTGVVQCDIITPYSERCIVSYDHSISSGQVNIFGGLISSNNGYCIDVKADNLLVDGTDLDPYQGASKGGLGINATGTTAYRNVKFRNIAKITNTGFLDSSANRLSLDIEPQQLPNYFNKTIEFSKTLSDNVSTNVIEIRNIDNYAKCKLTVHGKLGTAYVIKEYEFTIVSSSTVSTVVSTTVLDTSAGNWVVALSASITGDSPNAKVVIALLANNSGSLGEGQSFTAYGTLEIQAVESGVGGVYLV